MISIIVPVYNEEEAIAAFLNDLNQSLKDFVSYEIIIVNDGSSDKTAELIKQAKIKDLSLIDHVENLGYGKSLFDGILASKYDCIAIIDGDGSYPAASIRELYGFYPKYDMIVGSRQGYEYKKGPFKRPARSLFKFLAEYASGRKVPDVNSGLRIFKKEIVIKFKDSLCTGFSFTTTLTLISLLNHYYVKYVPIEYKERKGKSKVKPFKDTLRAGQIIIEAFLYYNPIKLFLLIAFCNLIIGLALGFLNHLFLCSILISIVSAVCIASFIPIFCIGLVTDQLKKIYNLSRNQKE